MSETTYDRDIECRSCGRKPTQRFEGVTFVADLCRDCFLPDPENARFVRVSRTFITLHGVLSYEYGKEKAEEALEHEGHRRSMLMAQGCPLCEAEILAYEEGEFRP